MEPFTTHFLQFQGGKFDHTNRMFTSIPKCYASCLTNASDVKELVFPTLTAIQYLPILQTPEFYYLPEFLVNHNEFNFGLPAGDPGNVELPPWATDAVSFVRLNRDALGIYMILVVREINFYQNRNT